MRQNYINDIFTLVTGFNLSHRRRFVVIVEQKTFQYDPGPVLTRYTFLQS